MNAPHKQRKETMTTPERMQAIEGRRRPDRIPFIPFIFGFCAKNVGYPIRALYEDPENPDKMIQSTGKRYFCKHCGTALWAYDERWVGWFYPHASCIDTPLPVAPETTHIMLDSKAPWVEAEIKENDKERKVR